jgi:hypothetical protein
MVFVLVMFHYDRPKLTALDPVPSAKASAVSPQPSAAQATIPVPPHLTAKIAEYMARDGFVLTRQKCDRDLCVSCFVTQDDRRLLGETWTVCFDNEECLELDTTDQKEFFGVEFGACERDEVPPIAKAN